MHGRGDGGEGGLSRAFQGRHSSTRSDRSAEHGRYALVGIYLHDVQCESHCHIAASMTCICADLDVQHSAHHPYLLPVATTNAMLCCAALKVQVPPDHRES